MEIQKLLSEISEFNDSWTKLPSVYRIAWISIPDETVKNITFKENIELPNVDHDFGSHHQDVKSQAREKKSKSIRNLCLSILMKYHLPVRRVNFLTKGQI